MLNKKIFYLEKVQGKQCENAEILYDVKKQEREFDRWWDVFYQGIKKSNNFNMHYYYFYIVRRFCFVMNVYYL